MYLRMCPKKGSKLLMTGSFSVQALKLQAFKREAHRWLDN